MTAAALAEAAPGRFVLGIGASSPVVVGDWNAVAVRPSRSRAPATCCAFLRPALRGETVDEAFDTFAVRRFRLERPPATPPPILLAALRPGMLRLAGGRGRRRDPQLAGGDRRADGASTRSASAPDGFEVAARIFVCPTEDADVARSRGPPADHQLPDRPGVRGVPPLARQRPRARADVGRLGGRRPQGRARRRPGRRSSTRWCCTARRPRCGEQVRRYVDAGVHTPILAPVPAARHGPRALLTALGG